MTKSDETFEVEWTEQCETSSRCAIYHRRSGKKKKRIVANLRTDFLEQQQKKLNEAMEVRPLTKKKQNKGGKNGLSSKLVVTPPSVLILPFLPYPKARDVESIPFHGLGEMVPISGDDFTLSTQTPPTTHIDVPSRE